MSAPTGGRPPDLCVACPRRSGTHFAIDAIRNNFSPHYVVESDQPLVPEYEGDSLHLLDDDEARRFVVRSADTVAGHAFIYWTHRKSLDLILQGGRIADPGLREAFRQAVTGMRFLYVFRDARDVAVSHCFLKEKWGGYDPARAIGHMAEWAEAAGNWTRLAEEPDVRILYVSYELLKRSYEDVIHRIGAFIGVEPASPIRQAAIRQDGTRDESLAYTTRKFRKGVVGDHVNHLGADETRYFETHCRALYEPERTLDELNARGSAAPARD